MSKCIEYINLDEGSIRAITGNEGCVVISYSNIFIVIFYDCIIRIPYNLFLSLVFKAAFISSLCKSIEIFMMIYRVLPGRLLITIFKLKTLYYYLELFVGEVTTVAIHSICL